MTAISSTKNEHLSFCFQAPLVTGKATVLQRYYRLSNTFSPVMIALWSLSGIGLYDIMPFKLWTILGVAIPVNALFGHILLTRLLTNAERNNPDNPQLRITNQGISVDLDAGEKLFPYENIQHIKVIYSGYERNLLHFRKTDKNTPNEITFKHKGQHIRIPFRLYSQQDMFRLQDTLLFWREKGVLFDEYNATSSIPVKSNLLELGN